MHQIRCDRIYKISTKGQACVVNVEWKLSGIALMHLCFDHHHMFCVKTQLYRSEHMRDSDVTVPCVDMNPAF